MIKLVGPPLAPRARSAACHWPPGRVTRSWSLCFCIKALAAEMAHMARACAIVDFDHGRWHMGHGCPGPGPALFGVALVDMRYHEVMGHFKGEAGSAIFCLGE